MKKIGLFLVMLLTVFTFAACGDDDDDDNGGVSITESELVGTWDMTSATINGRSTVLTSSYITFNADHTYNITFLDNSYVGTWTLSGNTITGVTPDPITEIMRVTSKDGNIVHIAYRNSEGTTMEIVCTKR